jgi:hypothetical protein
MGSGFSLAVVGGRGTTALFVEGDDKVNVLSNAFDEHPVNIATRTITEPTHTEIFFTQTPPFIDLTDRTHSMFHGFMSDETAVIDVSAKSLSGRKHSV